MTLRLLVLIVFCTAALFGAEKSAWPDLGPIHTQGITSLEVFPGPPNYESIAQGDRREEAWILNAGSTRYHLVVIQPEKFAFLRQHRGQRIEVSGTAFEAHTGHHRTPVLIDVSSLSLPASPKVGPLAHLTPPPPPVSSLFNYVEISTAFPWFFPAFVFVFGACVGSFLNVVIYRLPKKESVVTPGSHCGCGQPIAWYDNIPVLSWLLLRGKARCCGRSFSFRYAAIELLTGGLFLWCWLGHTPAVALCGFVFLSCLIAATFIDLDTFEIPDVFTIGLGVVGVLLALVVPDLHGHGGDNALLGGMRSGITALQGLLIGSAVVLWIGLIAEILLKKDAMGFGDVTFVGAIGAFCGWQGALFTIFGGAVVGTVWVGISLIVEKTTGRRAAIAPPSETPEGEKTDLALGAHVPFGPMLAIAGGLYFLAFRPMVLEWFAQFAEIF